MHIMQLCNEQKIEGGPEKNLKLAQLRDIGREITAI